MKNIITLLSLFAFSFSALLGSVIAQSAWAGADLIGAGKSDSAIKMLVFPKSLRVIENHTAKVGKLDAILSDPKRISKTLLRVDPARIVPAKAGESFSGMVTRDQLRKLAEQYPEDVIFIFRRDLRTEPENTLLSAEHSVHISYQGLLYLTRQKKLLALRDNEKVQRFGGKGSKEQREESWRNLDHSGLKALAKGARKVLLSYKFEKRQSAY